MIKNKLNKRLYLQLYSKSIQKGLNLLKIKIKNKFNGKSKEINNNLQRACMGILFKI